MPKYYLSICAIFRDEAENLAEWLEFHRLVGVEHFYLYNNLSSDSYADVLSSYLAEGLVTLADWTQPFAQGGQDASYQHCLKEYGSQSRWIAILDIDEFLFSPTFNTLPRVLRQYEQYPGVVVNWQVFGSSGHMIAPSPLVIESFGRRAPRNWIRNCRVKSIVDPARTTAPSGPHFFLFENNELAVTENFEPVTIKIVGRVRRRIRRLLNRLSVRWPVDPYSKHESSVRSVSVDRLRINHYVVKAHAAYEEKLQRYVVDGKAPGAYGEELQRYVVDGKAQLATKKGTFFRYHDRNDEEDTDIQRYLPQLRKALAQRSQP